MVEGGNRSGKVPGGRTMVSSRAKKVTTHTLQEMKRAGEKITMLTAYDYSLARLVDGAGVDVILVGDSASNVMAGNDTTVPMTLEHMIYHAQCVVNGVDRCLVVVDMPFGSYQGDSKLALKSAIRIMKESGGHAVKLEGGLEIVDSIKRILTAGIPVMGHLGLTPQSVNQLGGYRVQGRTLKEAAELVANARALEQAGAFGIVLETVPSEVADLVTKSVSIPTIGIGAGVGCSGEIQIIHEILGLVGGRIRKHAKLYADIKLQSQNALSQYVADVQKGVFPGPEQSFFLEPDLLEALSGTLLVEKEDIS